MEITLDVGKNVANEIQKLAEKENTDFDIVALKILDLGLRVYQSANNNSGEKEVDPMLIDIFKHSLETNFLIKEMLGHVFDKNRSSFKTYDHNSAISVSENMAKAFIQGKNTL